MAYLAACPKAAGAPALRKHHVGAAAPQIACRSFRCVPDQDERAASGCFRRTSVTSAGRVVRGERINRKAGRREGLRGSENAFCFWRTKTKNISLGSEQRIRGDLNRMSRACGSWRAARETQDLASRLPVDSRSIARGDQRPKQKLLRFGLQFGSPTCKSRGAQGSR